MLARLDHTNDRRRPPNWALAPLRALEIPAWLLTIAVASLLPLSALSGHNAAMPILTCFAAAWLASAVLALRNVRVSAA